MSELEKRKEKRKRKVDNRISRIFEEKLKEFSDEQKDFFLNYFENDPEIKKMDEATLGKEFRVDDLKTVSEPKKKNSVTKRGLGDDIRNFFTKVVKRDKNLQKRLDKHKTTTFENLKFKRKGFFARPNIRTENDSRVEFFNMVETTRLNSLKKIKREDFNKKKTEKTEKEQKEARVIADQFLYSDESAKEGQAGNNNTIGGIPKVSNRKATVNDQKRKDEKKERKSIFSFLFTQKFNNKTAKGKILSLKRYKSKLEEQIKECDKKIEQLDKKIEKYNVDLVNGIKVYRSNSLLSLLSYYRQFMTIQLLRLDYIKAIEIKSKELISKRIQLIDKVFQQKCEKTGKFPFYIRESFFCSVELFIIEDKAIMDYSMKIKKLEILIPQMKTIYQIEKKIQAKALRTKEIKKLLQDLVNHAKDTYQEPEGIDNFAEFVFQDEIQNQYNKLVRDIRTTTGESIDSFLRTIEDYGLKKIPSYEITGYIDSFVELLKKLFFKGETDKTKFRILRQLSDRLFFSLLGRELLNIEYQQITGDGIDLFCRKQLKLRLLNPQQLGVTEKFIDIPALEAGTYMPFKPAIEVLNFIEYCTTPNDMMWSIISCSKLVMREANEICKKNGRTWSFGADELLPIIIFVIANADCPYVIPHLTYLSKFGVNKSSETIYYLTCFEGASMYISNVETAELDKLIAEKMEEDKKLKKKKKKAKKKSK